MTIQTIPSFIILLGVLITVHELGHFLVAKALGFKVLKFSLGFGPVLWSTRRGETEYALSAFPLGGFVKFHGEELAENETPGPEAESDPDANRRFFARPVWHRIATVFSGPFMNLVLGLVLFVFLSFFGREVMLPVVGDVTKGMPAEAAGLVKGDRIVAVDGKPVASWDEMRLALHLAGVKEIAIKAVRGGEEKTFTLKPVLTKDGEAKMERPVIGIVWGGQSEYVSIPWTEAPMEGVRQTVKAVSLTLEVMARLFTGRGSANEVGGPIAIADMAGKALSAGILPFIYLMAALSVNLAVLNLLPVPILDGGLLVFLLLEAAIGRPVNLRIREIAQQAGLAMLALLIGFVLYVDIARLLGR